MFTMIIVWEAPLIGELSAQLTEGLLFIMQSTEFCKIKGETIYAYERAFCQKNGLFF